MCAPHTPQAEFSSLDLKGVVKPGLERLCEMYRTRASELSQDLISLREACVARAERNVEKKEENAALEGEVGGVAWPGNCCVGLAGCVLGVFRPHQVMCQLAVTRCVCLCADICGVGLPSILFADCSPGGAAAGGQGRTRGEVPAAGGAGGWVGACTNVPVLNRNRSRGIPTICDPTARSLPGRAEP